MKLLKNILVVTFLVFAGVQPLFAKVQLPKIFTDNMVLQRGQPVKIWGWANKGEVVNVRFNGQTASAKTNTDGNWLITLKPMVYGGPFEMTIHSKSGNVVLKNILIGDVWICSGQSNMEFPVSGWTHVNNYQEEIAAANYPAIRLFTVQKATCYSPAKDLQGGSWLECTSANIPPFSAVAYFFGRKLNRDLHIPIGLINSSWGGTNIQTWTSWKTIGKLDEYKNMNPDDSLKMEQEWAENKKRYLYALAHDPGMEGKWFAPETDLTGWGEIELPKSYEQSVIGDVDGIVWFRKEITINTVLAGKQAVLGLGVLDDHDEAYVNGQLVGKTDDWYSSRKYVIKDGVLKNGKNTIVIKVTDDGGSGGFMGVAKDLFLKLGEDTVSLAGDWIYKPAATTLQFNVKEKGPNGFPSQLYNAMIAPVIQFSIKGTIWYQGETNVTEAAKYRTLFPMLINDWRNKWGKDFPFYWVQLANYLQPVSQPAESDWAELREAQHQTLQLPQTGEAVIIDLGEAGDIHPKNKQDVGYRLALAALKNTYGRELVYSGPVYQDMQIDGDKVILNFSNRGGGLIAKGDKYGYLKGFAIAGSDRHFVWAKAYIKGDQVIVYNSDVKNPVAVRYAWADNPDDVNLYNREGLPASPFRTDTWEK
jgi:sialate O-acetylesterase